MKKNVLKNLAVLSAAMTIVLSGMTVSAAETPYTVKQGDNLSKIAKQAYGDQLKWREIYESNKGQIKDPDVIYPNQTLILPDIEGKAAVTETVTPTPTVTETGAMPETEELTWFERQGLTITPQGGFIYQANVRNAAGEDLGYTDIPAAVSIEENRDGVEAGYKEVIGAFVFDDSEVEEDVIAYWVSMFDRYTGTSFEWNMGAVVSGREYESDKGFITITDGDVSYDISVRINYLDETGSIAVLTVVCPEAYDGTVFWVGRSSVAADAEFAKTFTGERLYTIDEFPQFGDGSLYFSCTNS